MKELFTPLLALTLGFHAFASDERISKHSYTGVWESTETPDARFEVRSNGEFVEGLWFGPRQPLGMVPHASEGDAPVAVKLIENVEPEHQISTPFGRIQRKLLAHQSLFEARFKINEKEESVLFRTVNPAIKLQLTPNAEQLTLLTKTNGVESGRVNLKKIGEAKEQIFAEYFADMDQLLRGHWRFNSVVFGGAEVWATAITYEQLVEDLNAAPATQELFSKGLLEGLKTVKFGERFELTLDNNQKTSFSWNPVSQIIDVDAGFAKILLFKRLEFRVVKKLHRRTQKPILELELLGLETVGKVNKPVEVKFYFHLIES